VEVDGAVVTDESFSYQPMAGGDACSGECGVNPDFNLD
jgi:hypothetical protein